MFQEKTGNKDSKINIILPIGGTLNDYNILGYLFLELIFVTL